MCAVHTAVSVSTTGKWCSLGASSPTSHGALSAGQLICASLDAVSFVFAPNSVSGCMLNTVPVLLIGQEIFKKW